METDRIDFCEQHTPRNRGCNATCEPVSMRLAHPGDLLIRGDDAVRRLGHAIDALRIVAGIVEDLSKSLVESDQ